MRTRKRRKRSKKKAGKSPFEPRHTREQTHRVPSVSIEGLKKAGVFTTSPVLEFLHKYPGRPRQRFSITWGHPVQNRQFRFGVAPIISDSSDQLSKPSILFTTVTEEYFEPKGRGVLHAKTINIGRDIFLYRSPCQFGGGRFWFMCPDKTKPFHKTTTLYFKNNRLACRACHDLAYASQNLSPRRRKHGRILSERELRRLREKVGRTHYNGKPTKSYLRFLKQTERHKNAVDALFEGLGKKIPIASVLPSSADKAQAPRPNEVVEAALKTLDSSW